MRKVLFAGLFPLPPLGARLWLTIGGLAIMELNLAYRAEIWPHTPHAGRVLLVLGWLLLLAVVPQALWWAWGWLRAYTGPAWVRLIAKMLFMGSVCVVTAIWVILLAIALSLAVKTLYKL